MAGSAQNSLVNSTFPLQLQGDARLLDDETLLTDSARTVPLVFGTIMAQVASSRKWVPWTTVTATDGSAYPLAVYIGPDVAAADLAAGDVTGAPMLVGGALLDDTQVVFDKGSTGAGTALTLNTVINGNAAGSGTATPYFVMIAQRFLELKGLYIAQTVAGDTPEN